MIHSRKHLRGAVAFLLMLYWGALFLGTHLPVSFKGVGGSDKLLHFGAYAGLSFLLCLAVAATRPSSRILLAVFAVVSAYGAMDELSQLPIPGRYGDVYDWFADMLGSILGLLAYLGLLAAYRTWWHVGGSWALSGKDA